MKLHSMLLLVALMAAFASTGALAQSSVNPTRITRIAVDEYGTVFVGLSTATPPSSAPACASDTTWAYAFDGKTATGQALLSAAMSAKMTSARLRMMGSGTCFQAYNFERLSVIDILP